MRHKIKIIHIEKKSKRKNTRINSQKNKIKKKEPKKNESELVLILKNYDISLESETNLVKRKPKK
jgi:hypothetical protein